MQYCIARLYGSVQNFVELCCHVMRCTFKEAYAERWGKFKGHDGLNSEIRGGGSSWPRVVTVYSFFFLLLFNLFSRYYTYFLRFQLQDEV